MNSDVTISGPGADLLTVGRASSVRHRIFQVESGVLASISGLTISDGDATTGNGGGIYSLGHTSVTNCNFIGNDAFNGGGIYNDESVLIVVGCTFNGNIAANDSAGIYSYTDFASRYTQLSVNTSTLIAR